MRCDGGGCPEGTDFTVAAPAFALAPKLPVCIQSAKQLECVNNNIVISRVIISRGASILKFILLTVCCVFFSVAPSCSHLIIKMRRWRIINNYTLLLPLSLLARPSMGKRVLPTEKTSWLLIVASKSTDIVLLINCFFFFVAIEFTT